MIGAGAFCTPEPVVCAQGTIIPFSRAAHHRRFSHHFGGFPWRRVQRRFTIVHLVDLRLALGRM